MFGGGGGHAILNRMCQVPRGRDAKRQNLPGRRRTRASVGRLWHITFVVPIFLLMVCWKQNPNLGKFV